jgi:hypothetical protein
MTKGFKTTKGYRRYDLIENMGEIQQRLTIGVPMTGTLRSEWVLARYGQVIPCNWSHHETIQWIDQYSPIRFQVADARNLVVDAFIKAKTDWLLFIDHDVVLPPTAFCQLNEYMVEEKYPVVAGLYFTKSVPSEPLMYRGTGFGYYAKWKMGDKVWVDGHGMGCTLIHKSIIEAIWEESEPYKCAGQDIRRVYETPTRIGVDPETHTINIQTGTEDIDFLDRVRKHGLIKKAGWPKIAEQRYPYLVDTNIFCWHIDGSGIKYPARGEQFRFMKKKK